MEVQREQKEEGRHLQMDNTVSFKPCRTDMSQKPPGGWLAGSLASYYTAISLFVTLSHTDLLVHQTPKTPPSQFCGLGVLAFARILLFSLVLPDVFPWSAQRPQLIREVFPDHLI